MLMFLLWVGLFFITMIIMINNSKAKKKSVEAALPNYKIIELKQGYIGYNDEGQFMHVVKDQYFNFEATHIDSYEVFVDNRVVHKGSRALVGGLAFGVIGAIAGASSGSGKINESGLRLYVDGKYIKLNFLLSPCKAGSLISTFADQNMHEVIAMMKKGL